MQTCSWVLAVCLAVAVTARPEGMPPTVEAARVVEGAAPNAIKEHAAIEQPGAEVPAFKPLPVDAAKDEIAKPLDETKGETFKPLPVGEVAKPLEEAKKDAVKEEPAKGTQQGEEEAIKLPVPIEPDFGSPDDPKVFPEGQLRTPNADPDSSRVAGEKPEGLFIPVAAAAPAAPAAPAPAKEAEKKASRVARAYLPAEARGADTDGLELNLHPDTVLVPYYGGAKGQYLIVAKPVRVGDINKTMKKPDRPGRPGHKEEEEEEENVGEETNEPATKPPASDNDTVTIGHPPSSASMAEARPVGIAIAGEGGVASARPQGTAIVGPGGLAVARPVGTAIAGIQGAEYLITGVAQPQFGPSSFVYPLGPAVPSPLGVPIPYAPTHYAPSQYSPGHYPANHYSASPALQPAQPQWILYPPPGYQYI